MLSLATVQNLARFSRYGPQIQTPMRTSLFFTLLLSFFCTLLHAQWQYLPGPPVGNVTCSALSDNGILYIGGGAGIFKSTDGGHHWTRLPGEIPLSAYPQELEWDNGNLYLRAEAYGTEENFLFKSTDSGITWAQILGDVNHDHYQSVQGVFDVRHDTVLVLASPSPLRSIDGGATWEPIGIYCAGFSATDQGFYGIFNNRIYRSAQAATFSWQEIYSPSDASENPYRLEFIGSRLFLFFLNSASFFVSADQGSTWQTRMLPVTYQYNNFQWLGDEDVLYAVLPGGVLRSDDVGELWTLISDHSWSGRQGYYLNGGLVATGPRGVAVATQPEQEFIPGQGFSGPDVWGVAHPLEGAWIVGTGEGLFSSLDNGASWQEAVVARPHVIRRISADGPHVVAMADTIMFYSPDAGTTWTKRDYPVDLPPYNVGLNVTDADIALGKLYLGTAGSSWRSSDWGQTWEVLHPGGLGRAISVHDSAVLIGGKWSDVGLSYNAGQTWESLSSGLGGLPYLLFGLDWNEEYMLAVSGYRMMRRDVENGTWEQVALPLPVDAADGPIPYLLHFQGDTVRAAIAGRGVYQSPDRSETWSVWQDMPLYARLRDAFFNDTLTALALNGGVWYTGDLSDPALSGQVYIDLNDNGQLEAGEPPLAGHVVHLTQSQRYATTDSSGYYRFDGLIGPDTLRVFPQTPNAAANPPFRAVHAPASGLDFGLFSALGGLNLGVTLTNVQAVRPGFVTDFVITYRNDSYVPAGGTLCFLKDELLQLVNASQPPSQIHGDTLLWTIAPMAPGSSANLQVQLKASASVGLGMVVYLEAQFKAQGFDIFPGNNRDYALLTVLGSLDPNDKAVFPAGALTPAMIADTQLLRYTVRFQNTGTFPAEIVRIIDTLSPLLDLSTLRVVAASHSYTFSLRAGRVLEVVFDAIQLPDSTSDEAASHGFVRYEIKARPDLVLGQIIANMADIYFDFNTPVRTNTVLSEVALLSAVQQPTTLPLALVVRPNPATDFGEVHFDNPQQELVLVQVFSSSGTLIWVSNAGTATTVRIPVRNWAAGAYRVQVQAGKRSGEVLLMKL